MRIPVFCSLIPTEFLASLGHELVFLGADEICAPVETACNCHFHENLCSYVKALNGHLGAHHEKYDLIVVPTSCDAMKKLFNALHEALPDGKVYLLDVPQNKGDAAAKYFATELEKLKARLGD
jgi:benzoyl-CoA reductase/2-hydroxyglutaryl-CoA dehydratase subunit BcrC/BadD/HgdB